MRTGSDRGCWFDEAVLFICSALTKPAFDVLKSIIRFWAGVTSQNFGSIFLRHFNMRARSSCCSLVVPESKTRSVVIQNISCITHFQVEYLHLLRHLNHHQVTAATCHRWSFWRPPVIQTERTVENVAGKILHCREVDQ